ncbi:MAG TPA: hypothetical protein VIJ77_04320 [Candidatus Tumulicola sp.]
MTWLGAFALLAVVAFDCPFFVANDYYTRQIAQAPIDPRSDRYIDSMVRAGNTAGFWVAAKPVEYINVADASTPRRQIRQKVRYHRFDTTYPWSADFRIEPLSDGHAIVVQSGSCDLYETYDTAFAGGVLSAYSGAHWNLRRAFTPLAPNNPSAMASGLSMYAGMIRWEEVARGSVDHALNWAAPAGTVAQFSFVRPASDTDQLAFKGTGLQLPYGAHLRLRASFDISKFGPQSKAIARAMKTYGIYLADTDRSDNALYNALALDGSNPWNARDLASLSSIRISDFDVLKLDRIQSVR